MKVAIAIAVSLLGFIAVPQQANKEGTGSTSAASVRAAVEERTHEAWRDFKEKKEDAYAALLADDYTGVETDGKGPHDKRASVSEVRDGALDSYSLEDFKVTVLGANAAVATYIAKTDATMPDGKKVHSTVAVTEVWIRQGGEWKAFRYQESELS